MENNVDHQSPPPKRPVDRIAVRLQELWGQEVILIKNSTVKTWQGALVLAFAAGAAGALIFTSSLDVQTNSRAYSGVANPEKLMDIIKTKGCIADGLLSGYGGDTPGTIALVDRSECEYLHRSLETWLKPPDFPLARKTMGQVQKPDIVFGMFLAEALNPTLRYRDPVSGRTFSFSSMCKNGTHGFWGENTCKADLGKAEYRAYLRSITHQAIDMGFQSFMFGQIHFQENFSRPQAPEVLADMRRYAESQGRVIAIGAQTNTIADENYLKLFDYIEGGVGIDRVGNLEQGECLTKWFRQGWCWALLWHNKYASKAKNVILHLDWSGIEGDDMSIFARMDAPTRARTIERLYAFFTGRGHGFLMPFLAVQYPENSGCFGPRRGFYSPDNRYGCRDEDAMNNVLRGPNSAQFVREAVPTVMTTGEEYVVSVTIQNTSRATWTAEKNYRLGAQNPQDNQTWGGRISLSPTERVYPDTPKTFTFTVTAPSQPGTYPFQWRMLEEGVEWFGGLTENVLITVVSPS